MSRLDIFQMIKRGAKEAGLPLYLSVGGNERADYRPLKAPLYRLTPGPTRIVFFDFSSRKFI
jgi:hypothetical protein